jgi:hypothetical protein
MNGKPKYKPQIVEYYKVVCDDSYKYRYFDSMEEDEVGQLRNVTIRNYSVKSECVRCCRTPRRRREDKITFYLKGIF